MPLICETYAQSVHISTKTVYNPLLMKIYNISIIRRLGNIKSGRNIKRRKKLCFNGESMKINTFGIMTTFSTLSFTNV